MGHVFIQIFEFSCDFVVEFSLVVDRVGLLALVPWPDQASFQQTQSDQSEIIFSSLIWIVPGKPASDKTRKWQELCQKSFRRKSIENCQRIRGDRLCPSIPSR
jgi:hypothetical protein